MWIDKVADRAVSNGQDTEEICWLLRHGQKRTPRQHNFVCDYSLPQPKTIGQMGAPRPTRQFGADEPSQKQMRQGGMPQQFF